MTFFLPSGRGVRPVRRGKVASISGRLEEFFQKLEVEPKAPDPKIRNYPHLVKKPLVLNEDGKGNRKWTTSEDLLYFPIENRGITGYISDSQVTSPEGIRKLNLLVSAGVRLFVCFPGNFILDSPTRHFS